MCLTSSTMNYRCPTCSGPLNFDSNTGKLKCDYCDSSYAVAEIEALYGDIEVRAGESGDPQVIWQKDAQPQAKSQWDESTVSEDWGEDTANMRSYTCPSCGAELICNTTTVATHCPYCGNPTVISSQFKGALKPDFVIPFKVNKEDAIAALREHYKGKSFLPEEFIGANQIRKIQGVYVPYWLFDGEVTVECWFDGIKRKSHQEGDKKVTETQHFDVRRVGTVKFSKIPVDASRKMPNALMDSLEPFQYSELKPFTGAYLTGYLADRSDVSVEDCEKRADQRSITSAKKAIRDDIKGYDSLTSKKDNVQIVRGKVHYALLPVWILTTRWQDKNYIFAMNGQTGKFVGDLPVSKSKYYIYVIGMAVAVAAALYFGPSILKWISELF